MKGGMFGKQWERENGRAVLGTGGRRVGGKLTWESLAGASAGSEWFPQLQTGPL